MATSEATQVTPLPLGVVIGKNLRRLRERVGLTQYEMAHGFRLRGLNWTRSQIAAVEAGNRETVDPGTWPLLAAFFGESLHALFEGDGYIRLLPGRCQTRSGYRAVLSGKPLPQLPPEDQIQIFDSEAKVIRQGDLQTTDRLDADVALAQRLSGLNVSLDEVLAAARGLFEGRTLTEERDRRVDALAAERGELMSVSEQRAHRGHITRELSARIEQVFFKSPEE